MCCCEVPHSPARPCPAGALLVPGMAGFRPGRLQSSQPRGEAGAAQGQGRRRGEKAPGLREGGGTS